MDAEDPSLQEGLLRNAAGEDGPDEDEEVVETLEEKGRRILEKFESEQWTKELLESGGPQRYICCEHSILKLTCFNTFRPIHMVAELIIFLLTLEITFFISTIVSALTLFGSTITSTILIFIFSGLMSQLYKELFSWQVKLAVIPLDVLKGMDSEDFNTKIIPSGSRLWNKYVPCENCCGMCQKNNHNAFLKMVNAELPQQRCCAFIFCGLCCTAETKVS